MEPTAACDVDAELAKLRNPSCATGFRNVIIVKAGTAKPYQARTKCLSTGRPQRAIPGLFGTAEEAARALVQFVHDGSVWPDSIYERAKRGTVCS